MSRLAEKLKHFEALSNRIAAYLEELTEANSALIAAKADVARLEAEVDSTQAALDTHVSSYTTIRDTALRCVPADLPKFLHDAFVDAVTEGVKKTLKAEEVSLRFKNVTASQAFDRAVNEMLNAEKHVREIAREHRKEVTEFKRLQETMNGYAGEASKLEGCAYQVGQTAP